MSIHTRDTRLRQPWLLLASLTGVVFLTNSSTDLDREHYLCSTTIARMVAKGYPNKTIAAVLDISS